jgi:hypothetical protein
MLIFVHLSLTFGTTVLSDLLHVLESLIGASIHTGFLHLILALLHVC